MSTLVGPRIGGGQDHEPAPTRAQQKARTLGLTSATGLVVGSRCMTCPIERDPA